MRVLHVIPSAAPRDGGPAVAVRAMARTLAARGLEVTVATTDAGLAIPPGAAAGAPVWEEGAEYRYFSASLRSGWKLSRPLSRWLHAHVGSYDAVHVHALFSYPTIPACRAAEAAGVPFVLRPLGTLDPWSLRRHAWKKRPYLALIERRHLRAASAIHATSAAEADAVAALGYADRVRTIPLGVDAPPPPPREPPAAGAPLRLLFLSRVHPKKGLPLLLAAMAGASGEIDARLTVAGTGAPGYLREMEALCHRLGLSGRVRFAGHLEGAGKEAALREADVFVLPSYQENFGIAVAEAMAAGLPVLVSDQVGIAEEVREAGAGLVVPAEAEAIAGALSSLAARPAARIAMGAAGARLARERFSWDRTADGLVELYRDITRRS